MTATAFNHLCELGRPMSAPPYAVILGAGEPSQGAYLVTRGRVRLSLLDQEGAPLWSRIVGEGTILGLPSAIADERQNLRAETVEPTDLTFIEREKLAKLVKDNPEIGSAIVELLSVELSDVHRRWLWLAQSALTPRHRSESGS